MRRDPFDLRPGQAIDRYELLFPIDEGRARRTWAARLLGTHGFEKLVALKTLALADREQRELERPLWEEARLASRLQHPNIAQYFDLIEHQGVLCLTMEWIDGVSLSSLLRQSQGAGGLPIGVALQIALQVLRGLAAAHDLCDADGERLGPVHCDVSPHALMISTEGTVKLVDFGIARARRTEASDDLFSLGRVLYLLTTGRYPLEAGRSTGAPYAILENPSLIPPSEFVPDYPFALEGVVLRALAHDPGDRYPSASEMLYELTLAYPEYASKAELAECIRLTCGASLANQRAVLNEALQRPPTVTPSAPFPAATLPEPAPSSIAPTALAIEHARTSPRAPRIGAARMALTATALAFLGAFIGTLASAPAKPTARAAALVRGAPLPVSTPRPESAPAASPTVASSAPVAASSAPTTLTSDPIGPRPAASSSAAAATTAPPPRRSKQPSAPAAKQTKPTPIAQRYGI